MQVFHHTGCWALILGGSSGLGWASALKLAEAGMNICIVHRDRRSRLPEIEKNFELIQATGVSFLSCNVNALQESGRDEIMDRLKKALGTNGKIRLILHAISRGNLKSMTGEAGRTELSETDFSITAHNMGISLWGWVNTIRKEKLFTPDARVIGLTSEGNQRVWPSYAAISAAKALLEALARSMAVELAPEGIRTNIIQAGITDTPSLRMIPGYESLMMHGIARNPFQRLTRPEDVANVVYLLATDEAAWINGALIPVDGGERLR